MVQYIPSPGGSYPYPNAGKGDERFQMLGQFGQQAGDIFGAFMKAKAMQQQRQKQQALVQQLSQAFQGPQSTRGSQQGQSPQPSQPPMAGVGGVTSGAGADQSIPQDPMTQRLGQLWPTIMKLSTYNPEMANTMLSHTMAALFPKTTTRPSGPMVDTKWGPMTPYQAAGRMQNEDKLALTKQKMGEELARIQEGVAVNTEREYNAAAEPLDQAAKDLQEIHQLRAKLPAGTTDADLATAWGNFVPKTGVVKDPLFGKINPELKNYVQKTYSLQMTLAKRAANVRDPHSFTYQTLMNLVPGQKLPSLPEMDKNYKQFTTNVMAIKRTVRQQAAAKYRLMGMQQFNNLQQQMSQDPDLAIQDEPDTTQHDAVEAELYGN